MKNTIRTIITCLVLALFVWMNWATSKEKIYVPLSAQASIYQDSLIILENQDDLHIVNATLSLVSPASNENKTYSIASYHLAGFTADTIPMADFQLANSPYPDSIRPASFFLYFEIPENEAFSTYQVNF